METDYIEVTVKIPKGDKCWIEEELSIEGEIRLKCFCPFRGGDDFADLCLYLDEELPDKYGKKHDRCPARTLRTERPERQL